MGAIRESDIQINVCDAHRICDNRKHAGHGFCRGRIARAAQEIPSFTKGIITIAACDCAHHGDLNGDNVIDVFDLSQLIDYVFGGYPIPPTDQGCPHVDRGDVNCDGGDDVFDVIYLNDYLFGSGPAPCDPCACSPYPTNCP